jgi:hypothetical protein
VVGDRVQLDLAGADVHLRVEGDRDGCLAGNIHSVEGRRTTLRNHFSDNL